MSKYTQCQATQEAARGLILLPDGEPGFWVIIARSVTTGRRYVFSGTFADGDEALEHAKGVCAMLDPFRGHWTYALEFCDCDAILAQQTSEIDPDEPIPYTPLTEAQEYELAGGVEDPSLMVDVQ